MLIIAAGVMFVWPFNSQLVNGECQPHVRANGTCPTRWDRIDNASIEGAVIYTAVLLAFTALPLLRPRWHARAIALMPLLLLGFLGVLILGPIYVPAMLAMLVAAILPDGHLEPQVRR